MIAKTPPMGCNSWNAFMSYIDEKLIKEIADAKEKIKEKILE